MCTRAISLIELNQSRSDGRQIPHAAEVRETHTKQLLERCSQATAYVRTPRASTLRAQKENITFFEALGVKSLNTYRQPYIKLVVVNKRDDIIRSSHTSLQGVQHH